MLAIAVLAAYYFAQLPETPLLKALKSASIGSVVYAEGLSPRPAQAVCVLHPYQDRVYGSDDLAMRVNTFLAKTSYQSDEGHFAFIFISRDEITVERIKRSTELDMLSVSEINQARPSGLPANFIPEECVVGPSSAVTKITENERTFAVFGEIKP